MTQTELLERFFQIGLGVTLAMMAPMFFVTNALTVFFFVLGLMVFIVVVALTAVELHR